MKNANYINILVFKNFKWKTANTTFVDGAVELVSSKFTSGILNMIYNITEYFKMEIKEF